MTAINNKLESVLVSCSDNGTVLRIMVQYVRLKYVDAESISAHVFYSCHVYSGSSRGADILKQLMEAA